MTATFTLDEEKQKKRLESKLKQDAIKSAYAKEIAGKDERIKRLEREKAAVEAHSKSVE